MRFVMLSAVLFNIFVAHAAAEDVTDGHFNVQMSAARSTLLKKLKQLDLPFKFASENCLAKDETTKKNVCTFKTEDFGSFMLAGDVSSPYVDDVTFVCMPSSVVAVSQCLATYVAAVQVFSPSLAVKQTQDITGYISKGISFGDAATLRLDQTKYILQKVAGTLWFHIETDK